MTSIKIDFTSENKYRVNFVLNQPLVATSVRLVSPYNIIISSDLTAYGYYSDFTQDGGLTTIPLNIPGLLTSFSNSVAPLTKHLISEINIELLDPIPTDLGTIIPATLIFS